MSPGIGVVVNAITKHGIVELQNVFLNMIGDLEALELHGGKLLAQLAAAAPRILCCPGNDGHHSCDGQDKGNQPEAHARAREWMIEHRFMKPRTRCFWECFFLRPTAQLTECPPRESGFTICGISARNPLVNQL